MPAPSNLAVVRRMWDAYRNRGLEGILEVAAPDAEWIPYSAGGRRFSSTAEYRRFVEESARNGDEVEALLGEMWGEDDWVAVRGRLRVRGSGAIRDAPMHWIHRLRDGRVVFTCSSPELEDAFCVAGIPLEAAREPA